jgi:hypothetical protein
MKKLLCLICVLPLFHERALGQADDARADKLKRDVLGSWDCVLSPNAPGAIRHQKFVTPGRYIWVTFDRDNRRILAVSGGTWAVAGDIYAETSEFASDTHQHVRGKTYRYAVTVTPEKWVIKGVPGTEIDVDEVWNKLKPDDADKDKAGRPGAELLGTWEGSLGEGAPKAARILKYITPTHWTWAIFDRENKMVMQAMGGTWSLKDGKYEETVDFTTENGADARGRSNPFGFEVRDDRWILRRGPEQAGAREEVWTRLK